MSGKRIAISQSNYIPWKGYFDFISYVDEFVLYDDVQYTRRDWRNRNRVKTPNGLKWLTIPVKAEYDQKINEVVVADESWREVHWETIRHMYSSAEYFNYYGERIERMYLEAGFQRLSEINYHFLKGINKLLSINTSLSWDTDYNPAGIKTERLISICKQAGADVYVTGPAARAYLDEMLFIENGIDIEWMDYNGYREYPQQYGDFEHGVSILDLLFNTGKDAIHYMKYS